MLFYIYIGEIYLKIHMKVIYCEYAVTEKLAYSMNNCVVTI